MQGAYIFSYIWRNDPLEGSIAKLASTMDKAAALDIRSVEPPGASGLPRWLMSRASEYSQQAYKRQIRVRGF